MSKRLRVLMVEDSEDDSLLLLRELKKGGYDVVSLRVESAADMATALSAQTWDIVLADYQLPYFNAPAALQVLQRHNADIPFIIVSGTVGDEAAVDAMKAGASDYFAKNKLVRLLPAVERELREADGRQARRVAEQQLRAKRAYDALLREVAVQANIATSVEDVMQFALKSICSYTAFDVGHVFVAAGDRSNEFISSRIWHSNSGQHYTELRAITEATTFTGDKGLLGDVVSSHRPLWIMDLPNHPNFYRRQVLPGSGLQTYVAFPALVDNEVIAVFEFFSARTLEPDQPFLDIAPQLGSQLSRVIEREQHLRALRASEERFRKLFEAVPIPVLITRRDNGTVLETNDVFVPLINANIKSLIGGSGRNFLANEQVVKDLQHEMDARGSLHEYELPVRRTDGTNGWILLSIQNIVFQGEPAQLSGFVDITERKRAEESERQQRSLAESLRDSAAVLLNSTLNIDSVLDQIFSQIKQAIPHDASAIMLFDEDEVLRVAHTRAFGPVSFPKEIHDIAVDPQIRHLYRMQQTGAPNIINDTDLTDDWHPLVELGQIRSCVGAPLRTANEIIGFITLDSVNQNAFTHIHAEFLQAFANLAATAIQNARLYQELNRYANLLEARVADRTEKLLEAKEYVETILNSTSDSLVQIDSDCIVRQTNPAFDSTFILEVDELYGESILNVIDPADVEQFQESVRHVQSTGKAHHIELTANRRDGTTFAAEVGIAPITTERQGFTRCICSFHDISRQKQIEESLRNAVQEERTLRELKSRFVAMATHELRTPLVVMGLYTDLIRQQLDNDNVDTATVLDHLSNVRDQVIYLEGLMNEVLVMERADSGTVRLTLENFNVVEFVRQLVNDLQNSTGSDHQIKFSSFGDVPDVSMDKKFVRHIVNNLLVNAIKYSPESNIIELDLTTNDETVTLTIRDRGIGIPASDQPYLFEAFHRAGNVGDISGTGLGLAIVKRHIDVLGGEISLTSAVGEGSTFTVILPRNSH